MPEPPGAWESPSLGPTGFDRPPAYELKFRLDEPVGAALEEWARRSLNPDPNGDPDLDGQYRTSSLYFDTPEFDVYHRSGSYRRRKFRVRRYGQSDWVYLERKSKRGDLVTKRRVTIPEAEIALLSRPMSLANWAGAWFQRRLHVRRLGPVCRVGYRRAAYFGVCAEGPMRLTIDRDIRGGFWREWRLPAPADEPPVFPGRVILELKFLHALPQPFKRLVREFRLSPAPVSKYRLCCEATSEPSARFKGSIASA